MSAKSRHKCRAQDDLGFDHTSPFPGLSAAFEFVRDLRGNPILRTLSDTPPRINDVPESTLPQPSLLSESQGILAIYKPSGWAVHPAAGSEHDLQTWLCDDPRFPDSLSPIHRIDKDTSGLVLFSDDPNVRGSLGKLFAAGEVQKRYLALVFGTPHKRGKINRPLYDARRRKELDALTRYQRLEAFGSASLVVALPETGRKHQIRRHFQGIGHALIGDRRYPPRKFKKIVGFPGRLWLHNERLELPDGRVFEAPLPAELEDHLSLLRELAQSDG